MFVVHAKSSKELGDAVYRLIVENLEIFDAQKHATDVLDFPEMVYRREKPGVNEFLNVRDLIARGYGDCEDLAAALVAYYLYCGYQARPALRQTGPRMYHVTADVFYRGEWYEIDPSKMKGMK